MKKNILSLLLVLVLCLAVSGCTQNQTPDSSSASPSEETVSGFQEITLEKDQIASDIVFRKTDAADGETVITGDQIEKITMQPDGPDIRTRITFQLINDMKEQFHLVTKELIASKEPLSIWVGTEKLSSGTLQSEIADGAFSLSGDFSDEQMTAFVHKFSSAPQ